MSLTVKRQEKREKTQIRINGHKRILFNKLFFFSDEYIVFVG